MNVVIWFLIISYAFSAWFLVRKPKSKFPERILTVIHFIFLLLFIVSLILLFNEFRFAGKYTNTIIAVIFLLSAIVVFGLTCIKFIKIYTGFIAIPSFLTCLSLLIGTNILGLPAIIAYIMFHPPKLKAHINEEYNLEIHQGGLMAPPNLFYLTKKMGIVDKQYHLTASGGFLYISKVEIVEFHENNKIICKIYSENNNEFIIDTLIR